MRLASEVAAEALAVRLQNLYSPRPAQPFEQAARASWAEVQQRTGLEKVLFICLGPRGKHCMEPKPPNCLILEPTLIPEQ